MYWQLWVGDSCIYLKELVHLHSECHNRICPWFRRTPHCLLPPTWQFRSPPMMMPSLPLTVARTEGVLLCIRPANLWCIYWDDVICFCAKHYFDSHYTVTYSLNLNDIFSQFLAHQYTITISARWATVVPELTFTEHTTSIVVLFLLYRTSCTQQISAFLLANIFPSSSQRLQYTPSTWVLLYDRVYGCLTQRFLAPSAHLRAAGDWGPLADFVLS